MLSYQAIINCRSPNKSNSSFNIHHGQHMNKGQAETLSTCTCSAASTSLDTAGSDAGPIGEL